MMAFGMSGRPVALAVAAVVYAGVGCVVGLEMVRRGASLGTACCSLLAWPLLLSVFSPAETLESTHCGPYALRIDGAMRPLRGLLEQPGVADGALLKELDMLCGELEDADTRLARAEAWMAGLDDSTRGVAQEAFEPARAATCAAIEEVLSELSALHVQVGLQVLQGEPLRLAERVRILSARATALREVGGLQAVAV